MSSSPLRWQSFPAAHLAEQPGLREAWNGLNQERGGLPILDAETVTAALRHFGEGGERLLTAHAGDRCLAMVVVVPNGTLQWRTFQPSQMPLGAWVGAAELSAVALSSSLLRASALGPCLGLSITQVDPLLVPRGVDDPQHLHGDYIDTAWVDIQGSFDDYWAARGKNLRQNMRKQANKLASEGIQAGMRSITAAPDMPAAIARYGELEQSGWKASQGTAIQPDNPQGRFYTEVLSRLAEKGEALVIEYLFGDRVVASNLCVRRASSLIILKTTYDESVQGFSPAFLLHLELIQSVFAEQQIRRVEYYGRVMEWHTRWTDNKRTLYHLTAYRFAWLASLALARRKRHAQSAAATAELAADAKP